MKASAQAAHLAFAVPVALCLAMAAPAFADSESLLIWSPSKVSSQAYKLRLGAKTPPGMDAGAGVDLSVATTTSGTVRNTRDHARFWAEMRNTGVSGAQRSVSAGYNPLTGRVAGTATVTHRWMLSRSLDFVAAPSVSGDADMQHGYLGSVRVVPKAQILAPATGTTLTVTGVARSGSEDIETSVALEQRVFERVNLRAAVEKLPTVTRGAFTARLAFSW